jgi:hypothetical protein
MLGSGKTQRRGSDLIALAANDLLQKHPVSKRLNGSRTRDEDASLINRAK